MSRSLIVMDCDTLPADPESPEWAAYLAWKRHDLDPIEQTSFTPTLGRLCAIGVARDDRDPHIFDGGDDFGTLTGERALLAAFADYLQGVQKKAGGFRIAGHNVKRFDVPFIQARMIVHGMADRVRLLGALGGKPWESPVLDSLDLFPHPDGKGFTGGRSLAMICAALGIPQQTGAMGGDMFDAFQRGDFASIRAHLRDDVHQTREVFRRLAPALE